VGNLQGYLSRKLPALPSEVHGPKNILKQSNSHIISMNIAGLLFELQWVNECFYMLQLSL
jgi:hypothetical protein